MIDLWSVIIAWVALGVAIWCVIQILKGDRE